MGPPNGSSYGSLPNAGSSTTNGTTYHQLENGEATSERASLLVGERHNNDDADNDPQKLSKCFHVPLLIKWFLIALVLACATVLATFTYQQWHTFREPHESHIDPNYRQGPLSQLHPVADLGLFSFDRPLASQPTVPRSLQAPHRGAALPTNAWYQSFLLLGNKEQPTSLHRAYSIPYILDAAGPIAGIRVYPHHVGATSNVIQTYVIENQGLTAGLATADGVSGGKRYQVELMTPLGITLSWMDSKVTSTIVKGMPYLTLEYEDIPLLSEHHDPMYPTIVSEIPIHTDYITIDETTKWTCDDDSSSPVWVHHEIQFYVPISDFTWLVFVSEPVQVKCVVKHDGQVWLQIVAREADRSGPFVLRSALYMTCTKNRNPLYCHQEQLHPSALHWGQGEYGQILRQHAHLYAGQQSKFSYDFDDTERMAVLEFDWDVQSTYYLHPETVNATNSMELLSFALPHHWDMERTMRSPSTHQIYCSASLLGPACLVEGSVWHLFETIPQIGMRMPRPPAPWALPEISKSLQKDLQFRLPDFFQHGAGDTYFSGKMLAKLGRVLIMAEELVEICGNATKVNYDWGEPVVYTEACNGLTLPSKSDRNAALSSLRKSVQVWIDGTALAPFVYDPSWGGVVNCGCLFDEENGTCQNEFPDCPAFSLPGLNFGNAFYNDMHFHYGYHIYASAVVAHFDPDWGKQFFERVLLLIRNIANPSSEDTFFPVMRHKDPYQGHSWASGIVQPPYRNGRNQESSSESIAAYESVAIYGEVMSKIFKENDDRLKLAAAERVRRVGKYTATSELRSTKRYYHIDHSNPVRIYPQTYNYLSIGIMWQSMAQFQTWFGNAPYLVYGIQLMPVTAIGEQRDSIDWVKSIYFSMADSCDEYPDCTATGWSVQVLGSLATAGHPRLAAEKALALPDGAFTSAGGDGHSLTNTLWYIATRPKVRHPLVLPSEHMETQQPILPVNHTVAPEDDHTLSDCYQPETCTDFVLDTVTDLYTCRQRIQWLMWEVGQTQQDACTRISMEFPDECGGCNPLGVNLTNATMATTCPPCTERQCRSDLNRCPQYEHTYVCTAGSNTGGCSGFPWDLGTGLCQDCCELTKCPQLSPADLLTYENGWGDNECAACSPKQCRERNVCPPSGMAPYLCLEGDSADGCSTRPWNLHNGQCSTCCTVGDGCEQAQIVVKGK